MRDALEALITANLAAAAAVVVVLALRLPVRQWFGPRVAYGLWILAPLAALTTLAPARVVVVAAPALAPMDGAPVVDAVALPASAAAATPIDLWSAAAVLWLLGVAVSVAWLAWRQLEFVRAARAGLAGPAAVGVVRPRVVLPSDFARRYTEREGQVVLAHERAHIARHDPRINAVVALARCINWFNPLVHVLASRLRIDQELACDAAVVAAHPQARRAYAEAMLKTQLAHRPPPLGCAWLAPGDHPLAERVRLLARPDPGRGRHRLGAAMVALLALGAVGTAWASKPANFVMAEPSLNEPVPAPRPRRAPKPPKPAPAQAPEAAPPARLIVAADDRSDAVAALTELEASADARPLVAAPEIASRPARAPHRVFAAARRSQVDPGTAVRVIASYIDPDGRPLMTDLTSYGSQHFYRTGAYIRDRSRHVLFTQVVQEGETFWVTAALNRNFQGPSVGAVGLRSGETRDVVLGDGQVVKVSATARPETPEEMTGARDSLQASAAEIDRSSRAAWARLKAEEASTRVRCRREACQARSAD